MRILRSCSSAAEQLTLNQRVTGSNPVRDTRGGKLLKKVIIWGGIAFIVFFAAFRPDAAGEAVRFLGNTAVDIFQGVGDFFGSLVD